MCPLVSGNGRVLRSVALIAAGTALTAGAALPAVASAPTAAGPTVQPTSTRTAPSIAALDAAAAASNRRAVATCQTAAKAGIVLYWARVAVQTASTTETRTDDGIAKAREQIARAAADRTGAVCAAARAKAVSDRRASQAAHRILSKFGVYPLPISERDAVGYRLSAADLRGVAEARVWASGEKPRYVRQRESGGDYTINTGNGYYGAYQFDYSSWLANGGGRFANTADRAPAWAQDFVAWSYWRVAGWGPWGG